LCRPVSLQPSPVFLRRLHRRLPVSDLIPAIDRHAYSWN
jgi:hypothetical protein